MTKQIRLNAFAMNCVTHQSPGLWTHPRDRTKDYNKLGLLDSIWRKRWSAAGSTACSSPTCSASTTSMRAIPDAALRNAAQTPANEPLDADPGDGRR